MPQHEAEAESRRKASAGGRSYCSHTVGTRAGRLSRFIPDFRFNPVGHRQTRPAV